jgi:formylglycine-generating enzyme required for sulfatase activity
MAQYRNKNKKIKIYQQEYLPVKGDVYFGKYEVSYYEYFVFLNDLRNSGNKELFEKYKIDSLSIDSNYKSNHYYHQKDYTLNNFPVNNISYDAAIEFCNWKTNQYNNDIKRKFNKVIFRLPTEKEWEFAARGGRSQLPFPWGGPYLRGYDGRFLCNFNRIGQEHITYDVITKKYQVINDDETIEYGLNDRSLITCEINQFKPNDFGLYNMSGNVAEMVIEKGLAKGGGFRDPGYDIRIVSKKTYSVPSDDIGFRVVMEVVEKTKQKDLIDKSMPSSPGIAQSSIQ